MIRKKLPIGIQTFREIIEEGHYYVDKSGIAVRLVNEGKYYFLSRPRRFGKSLFLDTLKELFEGNESLFKGLAAETLWDWSRRFAVIFISFAEGVVHSREALNAKITEQIDVNQEALGLHTTQPMLSGRFSELIRLTRAKYGQRVVVLVDEYDKPMLDNITDPGIASDMCDGLRDLYSVIKGQDANLQFAMLTGVSKFSKVSLFSGLNNLTDITLDERYSDICGYTDSDIDTVFAPELPGLDRELIRDWYNGYNWLGTPVYNPFGLLRLFDTRQFKPHWFETGTPDFLIKLLEKRQQFTPDLSRIVASDTLLSTFDIDNIPVEALLFQTGYLTIDSVWYAPGQMEITLKYPNLEVQASLNNCLLQSLTGSLNVPGPQITRLYKLLIERDFVGLKNLFHAFYASIANDWYRKNEMSDYEGYYVSIFYSYFAALGLHIQLEDPTNLGCIDMTVLFQGHVYLFEFKVVKVRSRGQALKQIKERNYAQKYQNRGEPIHLIGVEFSKASRNIVRFEVETLPI